MPNRIQQVNRDKEAINICLKTFIEKGVLETRSRDLSKALSLQSGGMYYYFSSMDDAVIACAEEAANILETQLIVSALRDLDNPELLMKNLKERADELSPMMQFLIQASTTNRYREKLHPVLDRISKRYEEYVHKFSMKLHCDVEEIEPYVYMGITSVTNYMLFGDDKFILSQTQLIKKEIEKLKMRMSD